MKGNWGSEVLLRVEALSKDIFATTDTLRAPVYTWSTKRYRHVALRHTQMWEITKDGQVCHHLLHTPQPWDTRQMKVTCSLDTTSTLIATTLALARNFCLYQESSTRLSVIRADDELASK
jgi:hypothetical protein